MLFAMCWLAWNALFAGAAGAVEMCSAQGREFMRRAEIAEVRIERACELERRNLSLLTLAVEGAEDQSGYCRVTLALHNNTLRYINHLTLTSVAGRFEIFRFSNIVPGATGFASANSRILMGCDELDTIKIEFHWPPSLRMDDRGLQGRQMRPFKPVLLDTALRWNR